MVSFTRGPVSLASRDTNVTASLVPIARPTNHASRQRHRNVFTEHCEGLGSEVIVP